METTVKLPGFKLYDSEITLKPFTVQEVAKLTAIAESSTDKVNDLLKLIDTKLNVSIKSIYENDLTFIMWWLRFNTFPNLPKKIKFACPHCDHEQTKEITSKDLVITPVSEDYKKEGVDIELSPNRVVKMKLLTLGNIAEVEHYCSDILEDTSDETRNLMLIVAELEPELDLHSKYEKYIMNDETKLTPEEFYVASSFSTMYSYGVDISFVCNCETCGNKVRLPLEVSLSDFFPSLLDALDLHSRVRS